MGNYQTRLIASFQTWDVIHCVVPLFDPKGLVVLANAPEDRLPWPSASRYASCGRTAEL
jgi:hypothetical protein